MGEEWLEERKKVFGDLTFTRNITFACPASQLRSDPTYFTFHTTYPLLPFHYSFTLLSHRKVHDPRNLPYTPFKFLETDSTPYTLFANLRYIPMPFR